MGWNIEPMSGGAFILRRFGTTSTNDAQITFLNEADSHEAGEAVREFLGRPRVRDILAEKANLEAELSSAKAERDSLRKSSKADAEAASERIADFESQKFGIEKLAVSGALHIEKMKTARLERELEAMTLKARDLAVRVETPDA